MVVILESNRIPLERAMAARVTPVECAGPSSPLSATILPRGVCFSVFSRAAPGVELFFDREGDNLSGLSLHEWMGEI